MFDNQIHLKRMPTEQQTNTRTNASEQSTILQFAKESQNKIEVNEIKKAIEKYPAVRKLLEEMENMKLNSDELLEENIVLGEKIENLQRLLKDNIDTDNQAKQSIRKFSDLEEQNILLKNKIRAIAIDTKEIFEEIQLKYENEINILKTQLNKNNKIIKSKFRLGLVSELMDKEKTIEELKKANYIKPPLDEGKVDMIKLLHRQGYAQRKIAKEVGVSSSTVNKYVNR